MQEDRTREEQPLSDQFIFAGLSERQSTPAIAFDAEPQHGGSKFLVELYPGIKRKVTILNPPIPAIISIGPEDTQRIISRYTQLVRHLGHPQFPYASTFGINPEIRHMSIRLLREPGNPPYLEDMPVVPSEFEGHAAILYCNRCTRPKIRISLLNPTCKAGVDSYESVPVHITRIMSGENSLVIDPLLMAEGDLHQMLATGTCKAMDPAAIKKALNELHEKDLADACSKTTDAFLLAARKHRNIYRKWAPIIEAAECAQTAQNRPPRPMDDRMRKIAGNLSVEVTSGSQHLSHRPDTETIRAVTADIVSATHRGRNALGMIRAYIYRERNRKDHLFHEWDSFSEDFYNLYHLLHDDNKGIGYNREDVLFLDVVYLRPQYRGYGLAQQATELFCRMFTGKRLLAFLCVHPSDAHYTKDARFKEATVPSMGPTGMDENPYAKLRSHWAAIGFRAIRARSDYMYKHLADGNGRETEPQTKNRPHRNAKGRRMKTAT